MGNEDPLDQKNLKLNMPSQGWKQILTARKEMLDAYDSARDKAKSHKVQVSHGKVAEAECRKWLIDFLPKRFGVTSGYVVSSGLTSKDKLPHFDVIIYDQMESPVLWIEDSPDTSDQGHSRAIPVEHVRAVLEVKSSFSARTVRKAIEHLRDLSPVMMEVDDPQQHFKLYLPRAFCCGLLFFELRQEFAYDEQALIDMIDGYELRGFFSSAGCLQNQSKQIHRLQIISIAIEDFAKNIFGYFLGLVISYFDEYIGNVCHHIEVIGILLESLINFIF